MRPLLSWIGILGAIAFSVPSIGPGPLSSPQERVLTPGSLQGCDVCPRWWWCRRACSAWALQKMKRPAVKTKALCTR